MYQNLDWVWGLYHHLLTSQKSIFGQKSPKMGRKISLKSFPFLNKKWFWGSCTWTPF